MSKRGLVGALSALALAALGSVAITTVPASATTGDQPQPLRKPSGRCATYEVERPAFADGEQTEQGGALVDLVNPGNWIRFTTPADDATTEADEKEAYARWTVNPEDFKLKDLKKLKYTTKITEDGTRGSVAPAVRLILADGTKLVYEPYWNGVVANGDVKEWTVTASGAKLWDNGAQPEADETFADWVARKGDVAVKEVNIGVGTYNEGADVSARGLVLEYLLDCKPLDVVVTQPECDEKGMTVKFTNPNTKVNGWLWTDAQEDVVVRLLKPGGSYEVKVEKDLKYSYLLQKVKPTFAQFKRQLTFTPGQWVGDIVKYVPSDACPTTPPTTVPTTPATTAPTTSPATTAPATATPTATAPATTEAPVPAGNAGGDGGSLAKTGAPTLLITGGGVMLLVVGALLYLVTLRRRREINETLIDTAVLDRIA